MFKRNCWISFEPVEGSLFVLADYIGPHKIMWATDYSHSDGFFPGAPKMIGKQLEPLSPEANHQVLAGARWGSTACVKGMPARNGAEATEPRLSPIEFEIGEPVSTSGAYMPLSIIGE